MTTSDAQRAPEDRVSTMRSIGIALGFAGLLPFLGVRLHQGAA